MTIIEKNTRFDYSPWQMMEMYIIVQYLAVMWSIKYSLDDLVSLLFERLKVLLFPSQFLTTPPPGEILDSILSYKSLFSHSNLS